MATVLLSKPSVDAIKLLNRAVNRNSTNVDAVGSATSRARALAARVEGCGSEVGRKCPNGREADIPEIRTSNCNPDFRTCATTRITNPVPVGWDAIIITIRSEEPSDAFVRRAANDTSGLTLCRVVGVGNDNHPNEGSD